MIILPNQKAVFIHIPKTGGDSVTKFLLERVPGARHAEGGKHWASWMHGNDFSNWYKFGFVRAPVAWYKSYYSFITKNYIQPSGHYPVFERGLYHPMRRWENFEYTSFDTMVRDVYEYEPSYYTRLIDWMLGPIGSGMVDFIGRQEKLAEDLDAVLDRIGLKNLAGEFSNIPKVNKSGSQSIVPCGTSVDKIQSEEHQVYTRFNYNKNEDA